MDYDFAGMTGYTIHILKEFPIIGEGDDLVHQVGLQRAAEAAVLHGNHLGNIFFALKYFC